MSDQRNATVVEIVTFELVSGASEEALVAQMRRSDAYVCTADGFVDRKLVKSQDGIWTDLVTWRDMAAAKACFDGFMAQSFAADLIALINPETIKMSHQPIIWQPEMVAA